MKENKTEWFLDVEGDLFETKEEAEICGLDRIIETNGFFVGSIKEWKRYILENL